MTTTPVTTSSSLTFHEELLDGFQKLLNVIGVLNSRIGPTPIFRTWDDISFYLSIEPHPTLNPQYVEGWFVDRNSIRDLESLQASTRYTQLHSILITGLAWRYNYDTTYRYMQNQVDILQRTLEFNKSLAFYTNEITDIQTQFSLSRSVINSYGGSSDLFLYKSETQITLEKERVETAGRVDSDG